MKDSSEDAVITIMLLDKQKDILYDANGLYDPTGDAFQRRFWGYYSSINDRMYDPNYITQSTMYFWESNFYNMEYGE